MSCACQALRGSCQCNLYTRPTLNKSCVSTGEQRVLTIDETVRAHVTRSSDRTSHCGCSHCLVIGEQLPSHASRHRKQPKTVRCLLAVI